MEKLLLFFTFLLISAIASAQPKIAGEYNLSCNLGEIPYNVSYYQDGFEIVNDGDSDLEIIEFRHSPNISSAEIDKKIISPGGKAVVKVKINCQEQPYDFTGNIFLKTNEPNRKFRIVQVTGKILKPVMIFAEKNKPALVEKENKMVFKIKNNTEAKVKIKDFEFSDQFYFTPDLESIDIEAGSEYEFELTLIPDARNSSADYWIKANTSSVEFPKIEFQGSLRTAYIKD